MAFNMGLMQKGVTPGEVLVSGSSCLGPCEQGPTVVVLSGRHLVLQSDGSRRGDNLGRTHQGRQTSSHTES